MKHFFHSFLGTVCAVIVLIVLTLGIGSAWSARKPKIEDHSWLIVNMAGDLLEYNPPGGIMSEITGGEVETLTRILGNLEKAAVDDRVEGVIFKVSMNSAAGFATIEEIRAAIKRVQESGKKVYAWAESFSDREYPLLAACDEIYIPPTAYISFKGVGMEIMHVKNALDKLGIKPNVHKIKDYKSAAELVIRADSSEPAKENRRWLMNDVLDEFHDILLDERGLDRPKVEELMQHALFTGEEALEAGLVDGLKYWDELESGSETGRRGRTDHPGPGTVTPRSILGKARPRTATEDRRDPRPGYDHRAGPTVSTRCWGSPWATNRSWPNSAGPGWTMMWRPSCSGSTAVVATPWAATSWGMRSR